MTDQHKKRLRSTWNHSPPVIKAAGGTGGPPGPPQQTAASSPSHQPPTLTNTFNRAAHGSNSTGAVKKSDQQLIINRIRLLKKRQSAMTPTLSPSPFGNIPNNLNLKRDRNLDSEMKQLQKQLKAIQKKAAHKNTNQSLTETFRRSAKRSM